MVGITLTQSTTNYTTNGSITPSAATIKDSNGTGNAMTTNYTISYDTGVLKINKASLTPSVNTCNDKVYDGSASATCTISLATPKSGDNVSASGTCTFADKNAGNGKTVTCTGITLSGTNAGKYSSSAASASKTSAASITKRLITIKAND